MTWCRFLFVTFLAGRTVASSTRRAYSPLGAAILAVAAFPFAGEFAITWFCLRKNLTESQSCCVRVGGLPNASVVYPSRTLAMGNRSGGLMDGGAEHKDARTGRTRFFGDMLYTPWINLCLHVARVVQVAIGGKRVERRCMCACFVLWAGVHQVVLTSLLCSESGTP